MSGHQAAIWHCGILAKWLAAAHAATTLNAAAAWIVVDQDPEDFTTIRVPVRVSDDTNAERIEARPWRITSEEISQLLEAEHPPCTLPPFPVRSPPSPAELGATAFALPSIEPGMQRIASALSHAAPGAATAAEQLLAAIQSLSADLCPPLQLVFASRLSTTDLFRELADQMARDPTACTTSYNAAVAAHPHARIAPLATINKRIELPLWHIDPETKTRRRVWSDRLASIPNTQLAPRALMLTAILRLAGCDLFIHGTGGGGSPAPSAREDAGPEALRRSGSPRPSGYDAITDDWITRWLSEPLAPTVTVTADALLPLTDQPVLSDDQVARTRWLAHHARHDPAALGDPALTAIKQNALATIGSTRDKLARAAAFREMHAALDRARAAAAPRLESLNTQARHATDSAHAARILTDRTWAFPLHDPAMLANLSDQIRGFFHPSMP